MPLDSSLKGLYKAMNSLSTRYPKWGSAISLMRIKVDNDHETMYMTPKFVMGYNKEFVDAHKNELDGLVLHEFLHFYFNHFVRWYENPHYGKVPYKIVNIAMDLEINSFATREGLVLPEDACFPKIFKMPEGKTFEWYLEELLKNPDVQKEIDMMSLIMDILSGNEGEESSNGIGSKLTASEKQQINDLVDKLKSEVKKAGKGSCSDSDSGLDASKKLYNWSKVFKKLVCKRLGPITYGQSYSTYTKYNYKNRPGNSLIIPSHYSRSVEANLIVIMDVSGSCYSVKADMYSIMKSMIDYIDNIKCKILEVDTEVINVIDDFDFSSTKPIKSVNGGGTDLRAGWNWIKDNKENPDMIICLTDGYTPWDNSGFMVKKSVVLSSEDNLKDCPYTSYYVTFNT